MEKFDIVELMSACDDDDIEMVRRILESGVDVNAPVTIDDDDITYVTTPLNFACEHDRYEIAKLLLEHGADVNSQDSRGRFPLLFAVENAIGHAFLYLIFDHNPNLELKNADQETALFYAFTHKPDKDIIECMIDQGCDISAVDAKNRTMLMVAIHENLYDDVKFLVEQGADINLMIDDRSALTEAVICNRTNMVKYLIKNGADMQAHCSDGMNILFHAASSGSVKMLELCVQQSGLSLDSLSYDDSSLLSIAAIKDQSKMAEYLVEHGLDINHETDEDTTPLELAILNQSYHVANYLIKKGAYCDSDYLCDLSRDEFHLLCAFKDNDFQAMDALLKNNVSLTAIERIDGEHLFHQAVAKNNIELVDILLKRNVGMPKNEKGDTPLHAAVKKNKIEVVKRLVEHGLDIHERNDQGKTAMDLAKSKPEIKQYLECHEENRLLAKTINADNRHAEKFSF